MARPEQKTPSQLVSESGAEHFLCSEPADLAVRKTSLNQGYIKPVSLPLPFWDPSWLLFGMLQLGLQFHNALHVGGLGNKLTSWVPSEECKNSPGISDRAPRDRPTRQQVTCHPVIGKESPYVRFSDLEEIACHQVGELAKAQV